MERVDNFAPLYGVTNNQAKNEELPDGRIIQSTPCNQSNS